MREKYSEECPQGIGLWVCKDPHHNGTVPYIELKGGIRFFDVSFGYAPEQTVLHASALYTKQGMDALMQGRTVFVIAHRLSTIRNSDAILALEHGRIIKRGDHEELMEKRGTYYQLYTGALELA